jgi:hypothetical protein
MGDEAVFLVGAALTLATSLAVVWFLRRHLRSVLLDLTGTEARAAFWLAFTSLLLVVIPLIVAMFVPRGDGPVFFQVTALLRWSLLGLVATLLCCGLVIILFVLSRPGDRP